MRALTSPKGLRSKWTFKLVSKCISSSFSCYGRINVGVNERCDFKSHARHVFQSLSGWASITPGTVLIILAGRFKGKRVVFLKKLTPGLLLITGPFKVNGVPLKRVNQSNVIGNSTKVDITGVTLDKFDDKYFTKEEKKKKKKGEGEFFEKEKEVGCVDYK